MFIKIFTRRTIDIERIFKEHYIDVKALYAYQFGKIPCVSFIGDLDITKAFAYTRHEYRTIATLQHNYFDHAEGEMFFNNTIMIIHADRIIEFAQNYCQVLYRPDQQNWATAFIKEMADFRIQPATTGPATIIGFARPSTMN